MAKSVIVLIGPPGAGKGTQAQLLARKLAGVHLSSGEILRQNASTEVLEEMREGELVREPEVDQILAQALADAPADAPWILDGFIRLPQDEAWLLDELGKLGRKIDHVILLEVPETESSDRTAKRGRVDDAGSSLQERWQEYRDTTLRVVDDLDRRGLVAHVNGVGTVEEVAARINEALA